MIFASRLKIYAFRNDYSYGEFCLLERKGDQPFHVDAQLFRDDNKFLKVRYACIRSGIPFPIELPIKTQ